MIPTSERGNVLGNIFYFDNGIHSLLKMLLSFAVHQAGSWHVVCKNHVKTGATDQGKSIVAHYRMKHSSFFDSSNFANRSSPHCLTSRSAFVHSMTAMDDCFSTTLTLSHLLSKALV